MATNDFTQSHYRKFGFSSFFEETQVAKDFTQLEFYYLKQPTLALQILFSGKLGNLPLDRDPVLLNLYNISRPLD